MADESGIFEIMYTNRAMRRLKPDPVPEDLLRKLIDAGHQAPSGSNMQNDRWIVVRDPEQKAKLAELNKQSVEWYAKAQPQMQPAGQSPEEAAKRERMVAAVVWQAEHMQEIPALIIACLELGAPPRESFAAGAGAGGSIWPGVQNVLLAARALGLGAAPTTLGLTNRPAVREILNLPETIEPFCLIPVGYPMGNFGPVRRGPLDDHLRWDRWS